MTGPVLSIILDLVVLVFLGATIYYAIKLTKSLNAFRSARQEFSDIMQTLTRNINEAQRGIETLKNATRESGHDLQKIINEARMLAGRLENLNQDARSSVMRSERVPVASHNPVQATLDEIAMEIEGEDSDLDAELEAEFRIFDREFREQDEPEEEETPENFQSQAERDLYMALQKNRKHSGRGAL